MWDLSGCILPGILDMAACSSAMAIVYGIGQLAIWHIQPIWPIQYPMAIALLGAVKSGILVVRSLKGMHAVCWLDSGLVCGLGGIKQQWQPL